MKYERYDEYRSHPIFKVIRKVVLRMSGGICEICGERKATEVHHIKYPAWGSFDVPSNMKAVCHQCHSIEHGKEL